MRANIHRWNSNRPGRSFICCAPSHELQANYSDNRANPSAKLRFSVSLVSIARIDYSVHLRAIQRMVSSVSTSNSDSHLHLRSFPALSLCSRPFSHLSLFLSLRLPLFLSLSPLRPSSRPDLTRPIPRGNYVATRETGEFASSVFLSARNARSLCVPDPPSLAAISVPQPPVNFHHRIARPFDRPRRLRPLRSFTWYRSASRSSIDQWSLDFFVLSTVIYSLVNIFLNKR